MTNILVKSGYDDTTTAFTRGAGCVLETSHDQFAYLKEETGRQIESRGFRRIFTERRGEMNGTIVRCGSIYCNRSHDLGKVWSEYRKHILDGKKLPLVDYNDDGDRVTVMCDFVTASELKAGTYTF